MIKLKTLANYAKKTKRHVHFFRTFTESYFGVEYRKGVYYWWVTSDGVNCYSDDIYSDYTGAVADERRFAAAERHINKFEEL